MKFSHLVEMNDLQESESDAGVGDLCPAGWPGPRPSVSESSTVSQLAE